MIEFHRLAQSELRQAMQWYKARSTQAAERFLAQIDRSISRIETDPESYPLLGRHHRYVRVSRFPYLLVFRIQSIEKIVVVAVAHTSRRSDYWRRRT